MRQDSADFRDRPLVLPRDAPDCHPVAPAFAEVTQARRRAGARSFEAPVAAAGRAPAAVSAADARAFYAAAGLPSPAQLL